MFKTIAKLLGIPDRTDSIIHVQAPHAVYVSQSGMTINVVDEQGNKRSNEDISKDFQACLLVHEQY